MAVRKGCQKPSSSVFLKRKEKGSGYQEAVDLYNNTGRTALKWQEDLLKHILAVNKEGLWTHTKFGYIKTPLDWNKKIKAALYE